MDPVEGPSDRVSAQRGDGSQSLWSRHRPQVGALAAAGKIDKDYTRLRPFILSSELLSSTGGACGRKRAPDVAGVAERAAKRAKTPRRPVMRAPVMALVDDLMTDSPEDLWCPEAATEAAEEGSEGALRRGRAYTERPIPGVLASAIQRPTRFTPEP